MAQTNTMTKEFVLQTLLDEHLWEVGRSETFTARLYQEWEFALTKENDEDTWKYSLSGRKIGTNETWGRRYQTMEDAFLHIVNQLNENANVPNRYSKISEWLLGRK